jgi:hypothetical protein
MLSGQVIELEGNTTLNEGIKALLQGCTQLRRLALCFCSKFGLSNVVVTEEGIRDIGKYGTNLSIITLTNCGSGNGESLSYIANGCLQLRKLELLHCNFNDASEFSSSYNNEATGLFSTLMSLLCLFIAGVLDDQELSMVHHSDNVQVTSGLHKLNTFRSRCR